ncbi:Glyoxalase superfamily enzyme, possibly 3-demethylubiquinone-9 3-methyltransferase [Saccharopolyspora antimicrobica]|uniref:3-demethylubiquinone-9 3-methyltransferase (Glyoxalase superfamily) n=1 Tax=Saccharopolyspora antimicrobica TaxID=455193 RepID=A0A1I5BA04_9PSEU|nr:VOC family protein [Saccharopolyspora antimicrobica]RKT86522.1 putative 3-demethylubiquinone-9 3-methyltransferase (glyoxalase superfamily) [Saccharopolyspora antimicrobica]SFN71517.1 Glyoxalase superfamily enzyme, possibly 3-demethylubiquinone-9 3-methyltransferase [Saccharopolyspora antimicrobica]
MAQIKQKITTNLWFDGVAEEAAAHYTGIFEDSRITQVLRHGEAGSGTPGTVMTVQFELAGQQFVGINGGPQFTFTEAVSLQVRCESQEEVDRLWQQLGEGGEPGPCGWLKDKYGVSWQIVPNRLYELITDPDAEKADRVIKAMLAMGGKLDIAALEAAAAG